MHVLRSYAELQDWASGPVVISVGFFDGVHRGHQQLIASLREEASIRKASSLLVTFSNSPRQYHDPGRDWKFLMTAEEKLYALSRSGADAVLMLVYDESICRQQAAMFLRGLSHFADITGAVFGYDTSIGSDMLRGEAQLQGLCRELGLHCRIVPAFSPGDVTVKSSMLRELIRQGHVDRAAQLMGHPYFVLSRVVRGKGQGREQLDIATANQMMPGDKLTPLKGIYAGSAAIGDAYYPAAICVMDVKRALGTVANTDGTDSYAGVSPETIVVESHILDFEGDLYDSVIRLDFHSRIREWQDFTDLEELRRRMQEDIRVTRELSGKTDWAREIKQ